MNHETDALPGGRSLGVSGAIENAAIWLGGVMRAGLGALPIGLRRDMLYLWATMRLRSRPIKMLAWITTLGVFCYAWQWAGAKYAQPQLESALAPIVGLDLTQLLAKIPPVWAEAIRQGFLGLLGLIALIAAYRLRRRLKRLGLYIAIAAGLFVFYAVRGRAWLLGLGNLNMSLVLLQTTAAIFSSLNILSCISIFILAQTMRGFSQQNQLEALIMTPRRLRPSALYYALTTRYLPLAFIAVLIIYLDPADSPFKHYPFALPPVNPAAAATGAQAGVQVLAAAGLPNPAGPQEFPTTLMPLYWAGARELCVLLFCGANLMMDLAIAYWLFSRWRASMPVTIAAIVVIGFVTPLLLMIAFEKITTRVNDQIWLGEGLFGSFTARLAEVPDMATEHMIAECAYYSVTGLAFLVIALVLLWNLDARWMGILRSPTKDPILLKPMG